MASHTKNRRHGKVQQLPDDIRKQVNDLLIEPTVTYEDIEEFLEERGHNISSSSIGRYGKWFFNEVREIEMLRDQAALITADPTKALDLDKLNAAMMMKRVAIELQKDNFDVLKNGKLIIAFANLQKSNVLREQWLSKVNNKVRDAADDVATLAKKSGLSDNAAAQIRAKILGIAK